MILNSGNLTNLYRGFKLNFQQGLGQAAPQYPRVATTVPSTTKTEEYGWLGKIPNIREWLGDRVVNNIGLHSYSIKNKPYESTIGIDRDDIADDTFGVYSPLFTEMGRAGGGSPGPAGVAAACRRLLDALL